MISSVWKNSIISLSSIITDIVEQIIWPVTWTPVSIPAGKACKQLIVSERSGESWRLSTDAVGTTFFTVTGPLSMEIIGKADQVLFYAQTTTVSGGDSLTLELLLVD